MPDLSVANRLFAIALGEILLILARYEAWRYNSTDMETIHPSSTPTDPSGSFGPELIVKTHSAEETRRLGRAVGQALSHNWVIALRGELGAGKTTLTQGIAEGLGIVERVTSPTFTLVNEYTGAGNAPAPPVHLLHVDSYRLGESADVASAEADTIGLDDLLAEVEEGVTAVQTVIVIEWAERLADRLPQDRLGVAIVYDQETPNVRIFRFLAQGAPGAELLQILAAHCATRNISTPVASVQNESTPNGS